MTTTFLHTADWHLGKPYHQVVHPDKSAALRRERLDAITRLGEAAQQAGARFILAAGDLFDSPTADKATVSAACARIGAIGLPVLAIPGNHDHGGPGSVWEQDFFQRTRDELAPNLRVLLRPEPVELEDAVILPCPLLRRHEASDPAAWLRSGLPAGPDPAKPRVVLAHGSVHGFTPVADDEDPHAGNPNLIQLEQLPAGEFDYIALGDWHGAKQVGDKAWYSGTPELDRFLKGTEHLPGHVLVVRATRGQAPQVERRSTAALGWHDLEFSFGEGRSLSDLFLEVHQLLGQRADCDLLRLRLQGALGLDGRAGLEEHLESIESRVLRLKLDDQTVTEPTAAELEALTRQVENPLIARVATRLAAMARENAPDAAVARVALRQLHRACHR